MKRILLLSFMSLAVVFGALAQRTVSGKITAAEDGTGIPGVNVVLKGTTTGTTTDLEGNYRISIPEDGGVLIFSFIGMETQEVEVGARSVIDVGMASDVQQLTEVVVTAYGIERAAREVTYTTEKIDAEELMVGQQTRPASAMVGKIAGAQINIQDNGVNPQTQVLLRGFRSISKGNSALIVIDGVIAPTAAFNALNPNDIQSINILKGPNAAALYGSDAANGALMVTTKQGSYNTPFRIGFSTSMTLEEVAFMPDFQTKFGIGWDGHYDPIENTNWGPRFDGQLRRVGPDFPDDHPLEDQYVAYSPISDNLRDFYNTGRTWQNTAYFSGGDEDSRFYLSVGNQSVEGIIPDDEYERYTIRGNATQKIGKLELGVNASFMADETNVVGSDIGDQDRTFYWFILNTPANIPLTQYKDWDNPLSYGFADNYYNAYYQSPYWAIGTNRVNDETKQLTANVSATYDILDNVKVRGQLGVYNRNSGGKEWRDAQTYDASLQPAHSPVSSFLIDTENQRTFVAGNFLVSGEFELTSDIKIKPIVGASFTSNEYRESTLQVNNLSIPGFYDVSNGTGNPVINVDQSARRVFGVFADLTLDFRNWAFLNFTGRQDFTSTLPTDDNSYFYPSYSAGVVLTDAVPALNNNRILSFAKISIGNSTVYNDLQPYTLNERYNQGDAQGNIRDQRGLTVPFPFPYGTVNGFRTPTTAVDAGIKKEKLNTWEVGFDLGFLDDRIKLDGAVYQTTITDLITFVTPSVASGASSLLTNIGELESKGAELSLGAVVVNQGDFVWKVNLNYTTFETTVIDIDPNNPDAVEATVESYGTYGIFAIEGETFPHLKAQAYTRDPSGRVVVSGDDGNPVIGTVDPMGQVTPDYILGGTNTFSYKGLSLTGTFDYRTGHVYFSQGNNSMEFTGRSVESASSDRKDFVWPNSVIEQEDGTFIENTSVQTTGAVMGFWQNQYNEIKENYVKDATALKIRELGLNYNVPASILSKTGGVVKRLQVGFVARNLWMWLPRDQSNFSDPEFRNTRATDTANGVGIGGYLQGPPTRSFGFNLNVEF